MSHTRAKVLASDLFTAAGLPVPGIAGPAQGGCDALGSVAQALSPGVVDAYTYHQYPECTAPSPPDGYVFDTACLMQLDTQAAQCVATALNDSAPDWPTPPTWAGETADHSVRRLAARCALHFVLCCRCCDLPAMCSMLYVLFGAVCLDCFFACCLSYRGDRNTYPMIVCFAHTLHRAAASRT